MEFKTAKSQGLVNESKFVAYHVPVIVVQKGNPKNITTIADFDARPEDRPWRCQCHGYRESRGEDVYSLNISAAVEKNVVSRTPTINELTVIMQTGQADAALLTLDQYDPATMDEDHHPDQPIMPF